ncbi:MAG: DUF2357 domain-containing protein [Cyanobacteria bacterium REEB67]|nr:DUF2357 domain-containing protein [Cyanobacteria bacterium REEB67]
MATRTMASSPSSKTTDEEEPQDEGEFLRVINELTVSLPEEIALRLLKCGGMLGIGLAPQVEPTLEQEYFKLRAALYGTKERPGIVKFLPEIQKDCHSVLLSRQVLCAANKARKPDTAGLIRALTIPGNVSPYETLYSVYDTAVESSYNTYENRLVKAYIQAVYSRLSRLHVRLESAPFAFTHEMEDLFSAFRLARSRATFLNGVKTPFITLSHITMVLLKKPAYRAVLDGYLDLLKQFLVRLEEPLLVEALIEFYSLYKLWGTLRVINATLQACSQLGFRCTSHPLLKRDKHGLFVQVLANGQPAVELTRRATGTKVRIIPMKTIGTLEDKQSSTSDERQFLAIEVSGPGKQPGVLLFDTDYDLTGNNAEPSLEHIKADVLKMLVSLNTTKPAEEAAMVLYAAILHAGPRITFSPMVEVLPARPSDGQALDDILGDVLRRCLTA